MKTKNLFVALIVLMMSSMISLSSCKKDTVETPAPIPPYVPVFSSTALPTGNLLDFYITCPTDDYELISVKITYPGGAGNDTYTGNGIIILKGDPITFPSLFPKLIGTWSFIITGNIKSGTNNGTSFTASTSLSISGK